MRKRSLLGPGVAFKKCWLTVDLSQWRLAPRAGEEPLQLCVSTTLVRTLATGAQRPRCRSRQVPAGLRGDLLRAGRYHSTWSSDCHSSGGGSAGSREESSDLISFSELHGMGCAQDVLGGQQALIGPGPHSLGPLPTEASRGRTWALFAVPK